MLSVVISVLLAASAPPERARDEGPSARSIVTPIVKSEAAIVLSGGVMAALMGAGAVVGMVAHDAVIAASPSFFPAPVREGPLNVPSQFLVAAVVGAAFAAPLALTAALIADGWVWMIMLHPKSLRGVLAAMAGCVVAATITVPVLVVTCVLMTLVTLAARRDADRLLLHPERQWVIAALGWGLPILVLSLPVALAGGALRGALFSAVAVVE